MLSSKNIYLIVAIGLVLAILLPACTPPTAIATPAPVATATVQPTEKVLNIWNPESPTILNPHLSSSVRDWEPSRIVYEPLASFDKNGELIPVLAAEIPSRENGELAADGKSVIWKIREGLRWSDGENLTAEDVVFTYEFITNPDVKSDSKPYYERIATVKALDPQTIQITFNDVTPFWQQAFIGITGVILPKHVFEKYQGKDVREAVAKILPVGSGPYQILDPGIKPQEVILLGSQVVQSTKIVFAPNKYYRSIDKIAFDKIIWRGGGLAREAARLLYQDGSLDLGYTFESVSSADLAEIQTDKGKIMSVFGSGVVSIYINQTDPNHASDDQEFSSRKVPHPLLSDKRIRQAIAYAINRDEIAKLYGINGQPTYNNLIAPLKYQSQKIYYEHNLDKAKALLDDAGYVDTDGDTIREKDGVKMKLVFQGPANDTIQASQKIVQQDLAKIGIDVTIKIVDPGIMYSSGQDNLDSIYRFNADLMTFPISSDSPNPSAYMGFWNCDSIPQKANDWNGGLNIGRWCNPEYDALLKKASAELDPEKQKEMFIQLNDMQIEDVALIPIVWSGTALGVSKRLEGLKPTPWDMVTWNIQDWYFVTQ